MIDKPAAHRPADRCRQLAVGEDRTDPRRARRSRRGEHPARLRQLEEAGAAGLGGVLHEHAIRPMQQFDYSKGKNASDMAMVIDALDLLYTDRPEAFGIVSSDADFTPLVMHLRAKGAAVYGFGGQKTPEPFVNACSRFLYLDKLGDASTGRRQRSTSTPGEAGARRRRRGTPLRVPGRPKLKRDCQAASQLLRNAVEAAAARDGWAPRRRGRPADRQPGLVRPAQLRLRDADRAAQGDRAVRARQGAARPRCRCATSGRPRGRRSA